MARRGFFAEMQRQARIAQKERERREREIARDNAARDRQRELNQKARERARAQNAKEGAARQKLQEKEAREAHIAEMESQAEDRNQELSDIYEEIDTLLKSTLARDDYVDLNTLRVEVKHPPFDRLDLEKPIPEPAQIPAPSQPAVVLPEAPRGLASLFGKKKHAAAVEVAKRSHEQALVEWEAECKQFESRNQAAKAKHARMEKSRIEQLAQERTRYADECRSREQEAIAHNHSLEDLITNLGYGTVEAVQEYVSIILSNSVYPEHFPVTHEFKFDPETAELDLHVGIPGPSHLPSVKTFKYVKATDEIAASALSQKDCRERYASAVHQIALRSFHEIFEADRRGLIRTISLEVGSTALDPGTGKHEYVPFVIAAAAREIFIEFDLSAVVPEMTLARLGAAVSKNPYALAPAERAGVRRA